MRSNEIFQYYLCDYPAAGNFYVDINGMIQTSNVPVPLKFSPGGWMDTELKFSRSEHYYGINRSYSIPLKFVGDGAAILRHLFYTGRGIEQLVQLVVLRWQPSDMTLPDGTFRPGDSWYLYYKGVIDLPKMKDKVQEGVEVNVMEGGVVQLLKAYENAVFKIPCDGSIPQNIKVNVDGILLNDVFHYSFLNAKPQQSGVLVIPAVFQGNDGDNIGIIHNDPTMEQPTGAGLTYFQSSQNFLFSSIFGTTVRLTGSIVVQADWRQPSTFYLYTTTNESQPVGSGVNRAKGLVLNQDPPTSGVNDYFIPNKSQVTVTGEQIFNFDITQTLGPGENLFLLFFNQFASYPVTIVGGNFDISFSSRYQASRVWGITAWDLFQLIIGQINQLASNFLQTFNYGAVSSYLQEKLNWVYTSGDALRASTDPNYFQYYNNKTQNVANPNAQQYNQFQSIGPVIKISLRELFDDLNPVGNASLSNIKIAGQPEAIFFERKEFVYDTSEITMVLGEVADFEIEPYYEAFFNWLRIGWPNPQLDQKQGKFAWNTTAQWQLPIKTVPKVMDIVSKANADPYLIEYTRFNPTGAISTTNNDNDNSRFLLNVDFSSFILDFYSAIFTSVIQNTSNPANTNYELTFNVNMQGIFAPTLNGEFFVADNQPTIFVFNQNISGLPFTLNVSFQSQLNGLVTDFTLIRMWINGVIVRTWTSPTVSSAGMAFNVIEPAFNHNFSLGDSIWFTIDTTPTGTVQIGQFSLAVSDGSGNYFTATLAGLFNVNTGSIQTLIPLSTINPRMVAHIDPNAHPVVSYGFQYFRFIDVINNPEFTLTMAIAGLLQGGTSNTAAFDLYLNGQNIGHTSYPGTSSQTAFGDPITPVFTNNITFNLYDIVWALGSATNLAVWITNFNLTFTSNIKAYNLLRKAYNNISGIPNPTTAYNIEDFTPGRMLRTWGNWLRSITNNLIPDKFTFQELNKNEFVSTTLNGATITENQNINISDLDPALFLALVFRFKTQVPLNFADILNGAANGYIQFSYLGNLYYGFPLEVTQKPSLNDTQEWTLLASPQNQLSQFVDLNFDGLNPNYLNLVANQIFIAHTCPLQFVPNGITRNPQYNFIHMDDDWYINQVQFWVHKENYFQKWQLNDTIPVQILTNSIGSANLLIYDCKARLISTIAMNSVAGSPLQAPYIQLQATINPISLGLTNQVYYVVIQAGGATPVISEGIQFATTWQVSLLFQYSNSSNKQSTVWSTGYRGAFRAEGWIDEFSAESKFTTYEDQPADITLLNAIPYRKFRLNISAPKGVPDWVWDKVKRIMLLDTVTIDGHAYTLEEGAKAEVKKTDSWPKRYWSIEIREAKNSEGVTYDASGVVVAPIVVATIDLNAFQENPIGPPNLISVTQS